MSGHTITPYELRATRLGARADKDALLRLSLLARDNDDVADHHDIRDALLTHAPHVHPYVSSDKRKSTTCVLARAVGNDSVAMVFATDITGEKEIFRDMEQDGAPIAFVRTARHSGRIYLRGPR